MSPLKSVIRHRPLQPRVLTSTPLDVIGGFPGSAMISTVASQVPTSIFRTSCSGPGLGVGGCCPTGVAASAVAQKTTTTAIRADPKTVICVTSQGNIDHSAAVPDEAILGAHGSPLVRRPPRPDPPLRADDHRSAAGGSAPGDGGADRRADRGIPAHGA